MQEIGTIAELEASVLPKIQKLAAEIRIALAHDVIEVGAGLSALRLLRKIAQEETNQILHEAMLLQAAKWLTEARSIGKAITWRWNPRQTGGAKEPDLQACRGATVILSAEATTSNEAKGMIDQRMANTLLKLSAMQGDKYYFVATAAMRKRAETKISRAAYDIKVVEL